MTEKSRNLITTYTNEKKIGRLGNNAIVHAGLSFINGKSINHIVEEIQHGKPFPDVPKLFPFIRDRFLEELEQDELIPELDPDFLLLSLGLTGYYEGNPFLHTITYYRGHDDLIDVVESEDTFDEPLYSVDYFGDFQFVQLVIRAAKAEGLMKPFDILTVHEALDLNRTLIRFLIEFQHYMVEKTVAFPIESAVITDEHGFEWVDRMRFDKFHYDDHQDGI